MDTDDMDTSLLLYDTPRSAKPQLLRGISSLANEDSLPNFADLDPTFESTQNLQQLIDREGLFPDLFGEAGEEVQSQHLQVEACNTATTDPDPSCVDVQLNAGNQMHDIQIEVDVNTARALGIQSGAAPSQIQLVKTEDGTFTPVIIPQGEAPEVFNPVSSTTTTSEELPREQPSSRQRGKSRNTLKATPPSKSKRRCADKDSNDYLERRARNNVAVRKSRDKAKLRQVETEGRVKELTQENDKLQKKVDLLTKELTVLKGLFINVGAALPQELGEILQ